jgi:hypothetical protein
VRRDVARRVSSVSTVEPARQAGDLPNTAKVARLTDLGE